MFRDRLVRRGGRQRCSPFHDLDAADVAELIRTVTALVDIFDLEVAKGARDPKECSRSWVMTLKPSASDLATT